MMRARRERTMLGLCGFLAPLVFSACTVSANGGEPLAAASTMGPTLAQVASTQSVDLTRPLDAGALSAITVLANPDLRALRAQMGIAEAQVFSAGLYPDPTFSVGLDAPLNGIGLVAALAASMGLDFAAIARRSPAVRVARAHLDQVRLEIAWAEWTTGEQARLLGARVAFLEQASTQTSELRRLANGELARVWRAVSRGDVPASELETRRLAATDADARARSVERELVAARLGLNRLLGIDPAQHVEVGMPLPLAHPVPESSVLFQRAAEARADLAGQRAAYEVSGATSDAARLGRFPLPALSVNYARDTSDIRSLGPAVSMTLPIWNRGQGDVAVAKASRAQLRAEYFARLETIRADIATARSALEIALQQRDALARDMVSLIPQVEAIERAAQRGDLAAPVAAGSRMALLDKQIVATGLDQAVAELEVALELTTGQPLESVK